METDLRLQIHVFQAYPFLEAAERSFRSCRDFVRHILPQLQTRSPQQQLGGAAEAVLENEIDNEKVCMVSGDGVETASGIQGVKERLEVDDGERTESDSDEASQRTFPSWGRSQMWSPSTDHEDVNINEDDMPMNEGSAPPHPLPPDEETTLMHRLKSTFSAFLPDSTPPAHTRPINRQTISTQSLHNPGEPSQARPHRHSTFSMSSVTSPPPSPSIRRTNASHPDISSLVMEWANTGPANQTLTFKPS